MTVGRGTHLSLARPTRLAVARPESVDATPTTHASLRSLSWRFERVGIRWCDLDAGRLPGAEGGDLRILVDPSDLERAEQAVRAAGGIAAAAGRSSDRRTWFLRDPLVGSTVTLRVSTRLATHLGEDVSRRLVRGLLVNRRAGCVPTAADTDRFWLHALRTLSQRQPDPAEVDVLRAWANHAPVASSLLAEPVTSCLRGDWTVARLLIVLRRGGDLPRCRRGHLRRWRRSLAPRASWSERSAARRLGLTVSVVASEPPARAVLAELPAWPLPVAVVDVGPGSPATRTTSGGLLPGLVRLGWRYGRCRAAMRRSSLLVLEHHQGGPAAPPPDVTWSDRVLRRASLALLPTPDAVAVVASGDDRTPIDRPREPRLRQTVAAPGGSGVRRRERACLVLPVDPDVPTGPQAQQLGRSLWALLSWRVASSGIDT